MIDMTTPDINTYSIAEAKESLKNCILSYLAKDKMGNYLLPEFNKLPLYLEGPPGVGKTEIVSQLAAENDLGFVSFSLTHHTRNSLLGLPVISDRESTEKGGRYTTYTMSEVLAKVYDEVNDGNEEGILLLDEFPCMSPTIMPAMLAFLQTKNIGTHVLPSGWIIVLCGNPPEFNKHSVTFDAAITDRIRTFEVAWDAEVFIRYAKEHHFHKQVVSFLELHKDHIYRLNDEELVTCRGWENLSREIEIYEKIGATIDYKMVHQFIKSTSVASMFFNYYIDKLNIKHDDIMAIIDGKDTDALAKKFNREDSVARLNLLQLLQKHMIDEAALPFRRITRIDQMKTLFKAIRDKGQMSINNPQYTYMSPLEALNHIIENNGDTSDLHMTQNCAPSPFGMPMVGVINKLDLPEDFWNDKSVSKDLKKLLHTMCDESELKPQRTNISVTDIKDISERQSKRLGSFLQAKSRELKKEWNALSKKIDNIFVFLEKLEGGKTYSERFYYFLNHNPALQRTVAEGNSKEYMKHLEIIYG